MPLRLNRSRRLSAPAVTLLLTSLATLCFESDARGQAAYRYVVTIHDTRAQPVDLPEIKIRFQDIQKQVTTYLKDVKPLKGAGTPGSYETILPVDPEDRRTTWLARLDAPGFEQHVMPPIRFSTDSFTGRVTLIRRTSEWLPTFTPYGQLDPGFTKLKMRLENSPSIKLLSRTGEVVSDLGRLADAQYDEVKERRNAFLAAKASLLNIYHVLSRTGDPARAGRYWIDDLMVLRGINHERLIAKVQPAMFDAVSRLAAVDHDPFSCQGYHGANADLHTRNFRFVRPLAQNDDIVSVKHRTCTGALQLTLVRYSDGGVFADIDLDEYAASVQHAGSVIASPLSGGTDPLRIFEILGGLAPKLNIGYSLMPRPTGEKR